MTDWIAELCHHAGIGSKYRGFEGQQVDISADTRIAVLHAMGLDIGSGAEACEKLAQLRHDDSLRPAAAEVIILAGQAADIPVSHPVDWQIKAENTAEVLASGTASEHITIPALAMGIHRLVLSVSSNEWTTWILARPARAVTLLDRAGLSKIWGVTAAIYGMTDKGRTAIGTYENLGKYAAAIAGHGADFLGINPIHAMGQVRPDDVISPYSPSHRGFLNIWHIAGTSPTTRASATSEQIDYPAALRANAQSLKAGFADFCNLAADTADRQEFETFVTSSGKPLHEYAMFEVLANRFGADWRDWPASYRDHDTETLAAFERDHTNAISLYKWAQWQAEVELAQAQSHASHAGMRIGLYLDLAVGPRLGAAETWVEGSSLVTGATLGAPPDPLGPTGQSWGLAPQSPMLCRKQGYAGFAHLLRAVMRHAGMIRIDHILGLMRSFWIPEGHTEGAYVSYPFDAMLAVVAIESARSGTVVIGEDLGLVPAGFRQKLAASGIYGMDILQYMRNNTDGFADTGKTRKKAICAFATHDTPTISGFFSAEDARLRARFGALEPSEFERIRADRHTARTSLGDTPIVTEIHRRLARARSEIVAVQLDDIAETTSQQNLPGTIDEHPNWRRNAPFSVTDINTAPEFSRLGTDMRAQGRVNAAKTEKDYDLPDYSNFAH